MDRRTFVGLTAQQLQARSWQVGLSRRPHPRQKMSCWYTVSLPMDRAGRKLFRDYRPRGSTSLLFKTHRQHFPKQLMQRCVCLNDKVDLRF